ncbi:hypothetical protein HY227_01965, partial [Candidatus Wolfebacteria bacterium]|nr:hypothetical protein [Candidatus Wolfebacteria bacterium]
MFNISCEKYKKGNKLSQFGFSLAETLLYMGILAVISGLMVGILGTVTKVGQRETSSSEVTNQLNFVMQTIQRYVRNSSNIEIDSGGSGTSNLKLRMADSAKDPTLIYLNGNNIELQEGAGATSTLNSDKVVINSLNFKKFSQYPGHDAVSVDITMTYNSQDPKAQIQRSLSSAIARVSTAVFSSDVSPTSTSYTLGYSTSTWQRAFLADGSSSTPAYSFGNNTNMGFFSPSQNTLGFATNGSERIRITSSENVGIGTTTPSTALEVAGTVKMTGFRMGDTATSGYVLTATNSTGTAAWQTASIVTPCSGTITGQTLYWSGSSCGSSNWTPSSFLFNSVNTGVGVGTTTISSVLTIANGALSIDSVVQQGIAHGRIPVNFAGNPAGNNTMKILDSSATNVAYYSSMAVSSSDNLPVIVYYDQTNTRLKVLKCGNSDCSSGNTTTSLELIAAASSSYPSVAIGSDGFPVIAYAANSGL